VLVQLNAAASRVRLDREAVALCAVLGERDIPMVVLKGPATAYRLYGDDTRSYGDVDLLVPADRFEQVEALLGERGYAADAPPLARVPAWIDRRFPGTERAFVSPPYLRVDLHRAFHLLGPGDAWRLLGERAVTVDLPVGPLRIPDEAGTAMVTVLHASTLTSTAPCKPLEDLRRAIETFDDATWAEALERCRSAGLAGSAAAILRGLGGAAGNRLADEHLAGTKPDYWQARKIATGSAAAGVLARRREYRPALWLARAVVNAAR
jgi:hypothetical protein